MNKELLNEEIKKFNLDMKEIKKIYDNTDINKFNQHKPFSTFEIFVILISIYIICLIVYKYMSIKKYKV
jgi:hypothetical protein